MLKLIGQKYFLSDSYQAKYLIFDYLRISKSHFFLLYRELAKLIGKIEKDYATAKVCMPDSRCIGFEPELMEVFKTSRDYNLLLQAWVGWRDAIGHKTKDSFSRVVQIENNGAKEIGLADLSESWLANFEDNEFETTLDDLFENDIMPLYKELHAYVRRKLKAFYGSKFTTGDFIPAHLLGLKIVLKLC